MDVHSQVHENEEFDITLMYNKIEAELQILDAPADHGEYGHGYAHFRHLVLGLDAGYYSFLR